MSNYERLDEDERGDDFYALLGLDRKATKEEINAKYRHLSRLFHPDKHSGEEINQTAANSFFNKIKKAHEVLIDDRKRLLYDNLGEKGVNADELAVLPFVDAQLLRKEFERLLEEKEKRQLEQRMNPKGTISVGINVSEVFDTFIVDEDEDETTHIEIVLPDCETNQIIVNQSIDVPVSRSDIATIGANVSVHKGRGVGAMNASLRRILSSRSWIEGQISIGQGLLLIIKGFRNFGDKNFVNCSGFLHGPTGRPGIELVLGRNLTQEFMATLTMKAGIQNMIETSLAWERNKLRIDLGFQMSLKSSLIALSCARKIDYNESRLKAGVKCGTNGVAMDYSCETKLSQHSRLGLVMSLGFPAPIVLKVRISRANQTFVFPILLYEEFLPSAVIYGTLAPILMYSCVMKFIVNPYVEKTKQEEILRKRKENMEKLIEQKKEAEAVRALLKKTYEKIVKQETESKGLLIHRAFYGKESLVQIAISSNQLPSNGEVIDVKLPLQCLVRDSQIIQPPTSKVNIPGFYDPCLGEEKLLYIKYSLADNLVEVKIPDNEAIKLIFS